MGMRMFFLFAPDACSSCCTAVDLKFDTQSAQYRREGHGFFIPLLIVGHILVPIMIVAAHLTKNRFSKSPILMNFCYANVGYCTSFLLSSVCVNSDGKELTAQLRYYAGENVWASPQAPFISWNLCVPQGVATQVCTFW